MTLDRTLRVTRAALALCVAGIVSLQSSDALAAGEATNVRIRSMAIAINAGNYLYIQGTAPPATWACAGNPHPYFHFVLSMDTAAGKSLYAMLLSAEAQGTPLSLSGDGTCTSDGVERLRSATTNYQ